MKKRGVIKMNYTASLVKTPPTAHPAKSARSLSNSRNTASASFTRMLLNGGKSSSPAKLITAEPVRPCTADGARGVAPT